MPLVLFNKLKKNIFFCMCWNHDCTLHLFLGYWYKWRWFTGIICWHQWSEGWYSDAKQHSPENDKKKKKEQHSDTEKIKLPLVWHTLQWSVLSPDFSFRDAYLQVLNMTRNTAATASSQEFFLIFFLPGSRGKPGNSWLQPFWLFSKHIVSQQHWDLL